MNPLKADYYASGPHGYVKYKDVEVDLINPRNQLQVYSKCNQILPYQIHPIQIKSQLQPAEQIGQPINHKKTILSQTNKRPANIMQREQVLSVHIQEKRNNHLFQKHTQKLNDSVRNSTMTTKMVPKSILKHSMNQYESTLRQDMSQQKTYKRQLSERSVLLTQVQKQKLLRQNLQIKYERLIQTLIKNKLVSFKQNNFKQHQQDDTLSEDVLKTKCKVKYNLHDNNRNKNSWGQNCSQKDCEIFKKYDKVIFKNNQCLNCKNHIQNCLNSNGVKNNQDILSVFVLSRLENQIKDLSQRIAKTQQNLNEQKMNYEEDKMMNMLYEKDRQIEQLQQFNKNLKEKQMSQAQISNKLNKNLKKTNLQMHLGQKIYKIEVGKKQSFLIGFVLTVLFVLVFSSLQKIVC